MVNKSPKRKKIGALSIKNVTKIYDPSGVNVKAVDDCSMEIAGGEVCMIVGPSGCGKTTLLNAIAGFHSITEGSIHLDGELFAAQQSQKLSKVQSEWWFFNMELCSYGKHFKKMLLTGQLFSGCCLQMRQWTKQAKCWLRRVLDNL